MKKKYIVFIGMITVGLAMVSFHSNDSRTKLEKSHSILLNTSGSTPGRTGAPGEASCTTCHSGTAENGAGINNVILKDNGQSVSNYELNKKYTVEFNIADGGGKNGFQLTALDENNNAVGTFSSPDATTKIVSSGGRQYVNHTGNSTATTSWLFDWTSPNENKGTVTFYVSSNNSNGNFSSGGDVIRVSQHSFGTVASIKSLKKKNQFDAYIINNVLKLKTNNENKGDVAINIVDLQGKSVFFEQLGNTHGSDNEFEVRLPADLTKGVYLVHLSINNNFMSKRILIE